MGIRTGRSRRALLAGALLLAGCGVDTFETTVRGRAELAGSPGIVRLFNQFSPFEGLTNLDFSQDQQFKNQGVDKDDVDSVKLRRFTLTIREPATQDFSFLESIEFWAEAEGRSALVARKENIAALGLRAPNPTLELELPDVELEPFVTAPAMTLRAQGNGRQPDQDTVLEAAVTLRVDVDVL